MFSKKPKEDFVSTAVLEFNPDLININNDIHLVWVGSIVRAHHVNRINKWKMTNPHSNVIVWVDAEFEDQVKQQFSGSQIIIKTVAELEINEKLASWVQELKVSKNDKFIPNFAAASDIYRFLILDQMGGWYVDTDIVPFRVCTVEINEHLQFCVDARRKNNGLEHLSPSVIASKPKSLLTQQALNCLVILSEVYNNEKYNQKIRNNRASIRMDSTFFTTGVALQLALRKICVDGVPIVEEYRNHLMIRNTKLFDTIGINPNCIFEQTWVLARSGPNQASTFGLPGIVLDKSYWESLKSGRWAGEEEDPCLDIIQLNKGVFEKLVCLNANTTTYRTYPFLLFANKTTEMTNPGTKLHSGELRLVHK